MGSDCLPELAGTKDGPSSQDPDVSQQDSVSKQSSDAAPERQLHGDGNDSRREYMWKKLWKKNKNEVAFDSLQSCACSKHFGKSPSGQLEATRLRDSQRPSLPLCMARGWPPALRTRPADRAAPGSYRPHPPSK